MASTTSAQRAAEQKAAQTARQREAENAARAAAQRQLQQNAIRQASANRAKNPGTPPTGVLGSSPLAPGPGAPAKGLLPGAGAVGAGGAPTEPPPAPREPFKWSPDAAYNDRVATNKKVYDDAIADLDKSERNTKFEYGIDDPTNPFSRSTELKRLALAQSGRTAVSMNSAGLAFSGANLRAIARNKRNEDEASARLRQAYQAALDAIASARKRAGTDEETEDSRAKQESYDRQMAAYNAS